ncbi:hypothetical protein EVC45_08235 [Paraburkholderia sp. UYCP14C]|uniref:hypothetical protein n=1 Tax=Paraburkholderia sp. UYCP14C TaxID=2511130 RepID=UPI0010205C57|nr:hypothetical protein [Paraburkholderia sp. UYCP14C]RZF30457.1 hypothetical protein EVC45_08235 [Paraburkholderia sp. UYCP14C]
MQAMHHFRLGPRYATIPTYVASYLFPFLLFVYETHRVRRWIFDYGPNFSNHKFMGYEYLLMVVFVALQITVEVAFLLGAWLERHHDLDHRISNVLEGVGCSIGILVFDFAFSTPSRPGMSSSVGER